MHFAAGIVVKYGILFIKLDLLKPNESDIRSFPSVVLITNEIFLLFNFSTIWGDP